MLAIPEVIVLFSKEVTHFYPMNLGGTVELPFGKVTMVPAMHSSGVAGGVACGFLIQFTSGVNVYYAGDTALFGDMKLIGEKADIDYAVLPIGDNYTMGPDDAVKAALLLQAKRVIPVHYNTWPVIGQDPAAFEAMAEKQGVAVHIVPAGGELILEK